MQTLAITNLKGGTGKTTTALNMGAGLAELGRRVLLVDMDPQSSLTLATVGDCCKASLADVLGGAEPGRLRLAQIIKPISPGLDIAPSDLSLSNSELGIVQRYGREFILKKALAQIADYNVVLIDCAPSLGLLTVNGLSAAYGVLCPTLPTALDLRGLTLFMRSLEAIRTDLNPGLKLVGVLVCQYDRRFNLHQAALKSLQQGGLPVLPVLISKSVKAAKAAGEGQPVKGGDLAGQFKSLSEYINKWLKNN